MGEETMNGSNSALVSASGNTGPRYTPILPFNDLAQDSFLIYNNAVYIRDIALTECGPMKHNPNLIKYYTTQNVKPVLLGGD